MCQIKVIKFYSVFEKIIRKRIILTFKHPRVCKNKKDEGGESKVFK